MSASLPLILTLARLMSPLFLCPLIIWGDGAWRLPLAAAFTFFALTDWADGYIARRSGHVSRWGEILDPIADKVLVLLVLLALLIQGHISSVAQVFVFGVCARELVMSGLREGLSAKAISLKVSALSRSKTFLAYVACGLLILGQGFESAGTWVLGLSLIPGLLSLFISIRRILCD